MWESDYKCNCFAFCNCIESNVYQKLFRHSNFFFLFLKTKIECPVCTNYLTHKWVLGEERMKALVGIQSRRWTPLNSKPEAGVLNSASLKLRGGRKIADDRGGDDCKRCNHGTNASWPIDIMTMILLLPNTIWLQSKLTHYPLLEFKKKGIL